MELLKTIDSPADLKKLPLGKLPQVCAEIRQLIIDVISKKNGHFATNLGVVELTVALHYVYDFLQDRLVLDVGHQVYPHKILTGRRDRFPTIRDAGGLAGYPDPRESPYDPFHTAHASCAISSALGLIEGARLQGRDIRGVAMVGDGSLTGGVAYEGLNNAGMLKRNLLVVLNDNSCSISMTTGALSDMLTRVRESSEYSVVRKGLRETLMHVPILRRAASQAVEAVRSALSPTEIFSSLGFRYFGPVDGHDVVGLVDHFRKLKAMNGPVLLHALTNKGHGFQPAQEDPVTYHAPKPFSYEVAQDNSTKVLPLPRKASPPSYSDTVAGAISELARVDSRVVAITAAMPDGTGLVPFSREFPERFFDVGICEQHAVAFSGALAKEGLRPYVCIYSTFIQRAFDQIFHEVVLQENLPVFFALDRSGLVGNDGATHNGVFDIGYLAAFPNLTIMAPRDGVEAQMMVRFGLAQPHACAMRYPRGNVPDPAGGIAPAPIVLGVAEFLKEGPDGALVAYGAMVDECWRAAALLKDTGIDVT
ncbi:MAG TPA: 1-deoxy-D-xylulose-5-phosphate synthase, partial [Planctomycetota bacterium]|nr:1-deoxy-D-xylulose-5-phosphate synthase [Planctomycetota bacterium]